MFKVTPLCKWRLQIQTQTVRLQVCAPNHNILLASPTYCLPSFTWEKCLICIRLLWPRRELLTCESVLLRIKSSAVETTSKEASGLGSVSSTASGRQSQERPQSRVRGPISLCGYSPSGRTTESRPSPAFISAAPEVPFPS